MRIIFFGTPDFALPSLKALVNSGEQVVAVITQPDSMKGRGHKLSRPPVKEYAVSIGIRVLQPCGICSVDFFDALSVLTPDMIVVVAYGKILPPSILGLPPQGCINVHASILPKYRGAAPIQWAIVRGETMTGVTTMRMDEGLDTGDTLLVDTTEITPEDTALTLGARLSEMGARLLLTTIIHLKDGSINPIPQTGEPSYAPIIRKDHGRIDWTASAADIFNLSRGMFPWPGSFCFFQGNKVTLMRTRIVDDRIQGVPGRIEKITGNELHAATGKGILSIIEMRPEGKQSMSGAAYAHGRHLREGMQFDH